MPASVYRLSIALFVCASLASTAAADGFGSGANQFTIDFVTISGDAGDLGSWNAGTTFTGVNRDDYRIGVYEITNDQWDKFKAELGVPVKGDPNTAYETDAFWTGTNEPTNCVSWYEAAQFVNWLNTSKGHQAAYKFTGTQGTNNYTFDTWSTAEADGTNLFRHKDAFYYLPTDDEWIKAAYWNGTSLQTHATPDDTVPVAGTDTNYAQPAPYADGPWDVGSGIEELNGTFDIMGNLWEFVESPYSSGNYDPGTNRNMRSGSFANNSDFISALIRSGISPDYGHNKYVGFRVAAEVPEPASIGLLAVGGLALIKRKRRRR